MILRFWFRNDWLGDADLGGWPFAFQGPDDGAVRYLVGEFLDHGITPEDMGFYCLGKLRGQTWVQQLDAQQELSSQETAFSREAKFDSINLDQPIRDKIREPTATDQQLLNQALAVIDLAVSQNQEPPEEASKIAWAICKRYGIFPETSLPDEPAEFMAAEEVSVPQWALFAGGWEPYIGKRRQRKGQPGMRKGKWVIWDDDVRHEKLARAQDEGHEDLRYPKGVSVHFDGVSPEELDDLFGKKSTASLLVAASYTPDGGQVRVIRDPDSGTIRLDMMGPKPIPGGQPTITSSMRYWKEGDALISRLMDVRIPDHLDKDQQVPNPLKGQGAELFDQQVKALQAMGVTRLNLLAAGKNQEEREKKQYNGSYTWPRLGANAVIPRWFKVRHKDIDVVKRSKDMLDLFSTREGRDFWSQHGNGIEMTFDLAAGSRNIKAQQAYLQEQRAARRAKG